MGKKFSGVAALFHNRTFPFVGSQLKRKGNLWAQFGKTQKGLLEVFDEISDPLLLLDRDFTVKILLNRAAATYYGVLEPQEAIGKRCYEALRERAEPCEGCPLPSVILNGHGGTFEREGLMDPNTVEQVVIYPKDFGILIHITDITKTKAMERELIQNQKLASIGLLVSGIVHEIKNFNNCITFNIPILREYLRELVPIMDEYVRNPDDFELFGMSYPEFREDIFRLLGNLEHASSQISSTVSGLREFVRRSDKRKLRRIDLRQVIERAVAICRYQLEKMVKSFEVEIAENLPPILTEPEAVEHVLVNLLINAAQAAEKENSWVSLKINHGENCRDHRVIEVSDNGCGMDEEIRQRVFEPFFSTKAVGRGTGLGLFVSHNLIKELGGRIEVESEPGRGSTFRIILKDVKQWPMKRGQRSASQRSVSHRLPKRVGYRNG
jgi:signal transduction histidine kinase